MSDETLLPDNASTLERSLDSAGAARLDLAPVSLVSTLQNPGTIPSGILPWLAWAFSVDGWDDAWTDAQKRAAIAASYDVHRHKGTIGAVRSALNALGLGLEIVEWFQDAPPADPYTFRLALNIDQQGVGEFSLQRVLQVVDAAKNLRSHLTSVDITATSAADFYHAGATGMGCEITIQPG